MDCRNLEAGEFRAPSRITRRGLPITIPAGILLHQQL